MIFKDLPDSRIVLQELSEFLHMLGLDGTTQQSFCIGVDKEG